MWSPSNLKLRPTAFPEFLVQSGRGICFSLHSKMVMQYHCWVTISLFEPFIIRLKSAETDQSYSLSSILVSPHVRQNRPPTGWDCGKTSLNFSSLWHVPIALVFRYRKEWSATYVDGRRLRLRHFYPWHEYLSIIGSHWCDIENHISWFTV